MRPRLVAEGVAQGRELRGTQPRRSHATFVAPTRDPIEILESQHANRIAELVPIRIGRMLQSPFSYFRGTAAVMAHDLSAGTRTGVDLVICGDAHISNFGLFATPERRVVFDLNDFDEVSYGPWEWDLKRLVASTVVGGRDLGLTRSQCTDAALATARGYRLALARLLELTALDRFYFRVETTWLEERSNELTQALVRKTVKKAKRRTSDQVLAKITTKDENGQRRIIDEFPIIRRSEPATIANLADQFDGYRATVRSDVALLLEQFRLVDAVLRVVGVGSVGTRCHIALLVGPGDESLFIQVKEAQRSVLETYGGLAGLASRTQMATEGARVVRGQLMMQAVSDRFLGWLSFDEHDFYCRQFRDMKGSIELKDLTPTQFSAYGALCGSVLARGHSQSAGASVVSGYLGASPRMDEALVSWAHASADQNERDFGALQAAVKVGRLPAELGV